MCYLPLGSVLLCGYKIIYCNTWPSYISLCVVICANISLLFFSKVLLKKLFLSSIGIKKKGPEINLVLLPKSQFLHVCRFESPFDLKLNRLKIVKKLAKERIYLNAGSLRSLPCRHGSGNKVLFLPALLLVNRMKLSELPHRVQYLRQSSNVKAFHIFQM